MNNNEPNNNELNSVSLGNMGNMNNVNPTPTSEVTNTPPIPQEEVNSNLTPVSPLTEENESAILNANMESNNLNTINEPNYTNSIPPVAPLMEENSVNNVLSSNIETIPPMVDDSNSKKNKGKPNKILFIIIIVLSLTAVGVGVYIILGLTKKPIGNNTPSVKVKEVKIEIGSEIPTDIKNYADFNNIDTSTCSIDTTNITDTNTLNATYKFTINCINNKSYEGTATIVDTTKPEVTTKNVTVGLNSQISALDFIEKCDDKSSCSYAFKDENAVMDNLKTPGEYEVEIIVQDAAKNSVEVKAKMTVTDTPIADIYIVCKSSNSNEVTKYGIVNSEFNKTALRIYTYTLEESAYNSLKTSSTDLNNVTYDGKTGAGVFDDENHTLTLTVNLSYDEIVAEAGSEIPTTASELRNFYNNKGYSCSIGY